MTDMNNTLASQDIIAPLAQEGTKAVLRGWLKRAGDQVVKDEPVLELETDKVMVEVCAPSSGTLEVVLAEGADAEPGAVLGRVVQGQLQGHVQAPEAEFEASAETTGPTTEALHFDPQIRLSPAVRRLLSDHHMDPAGLTGTGRDGRLTRADVAAAIELRDRQPAVAPVVKDPSIAPAAAVPVSRPVAKAPVSDGQGPSVAAHVPHSSMRRRIAEHMQHSMSVAPHVTAVFEADFGAIIAHRKQHKAEFAAQGVNLTFTSYFVAAAAQAMQAAPEVNSRWHADYLEVFRDINIGVGAALGDKGLIVPVIRQVQDLSLLGIAARLQSLTEAARNNKLKPGDVQGGTFTISNHGVSGSLFAAPIIINQPQSAILGIGALEKRVVVREVDGADTLQIRSRAYVSLTIDHRVLDGSQTNAWLSRFVAIIEGWGASS